jgi:hypothetical protein
LGATQHEVAITWEGKHYGRAKARLDGYNEHAAIGIVDLKTTRNLAAFGRLFFNYRYDLQFGWYAEGTDSDAAAVIAVESVAPYDCGVFRIPHTLLQDWRGEAIEVATRYRIAELTGIFGGVVEGGEAELPIPKWYGEGKAATVPTEEGEASEL